MTDPFPPFLTIGNDELGGPTPKRITCPHCGRRHRVRTTHSKKLADGQWIQGDMTLQTYWCGDATYLVGINGRRIDKPCEPKTPTTS